MSKLALYINFALIFFPAFSLSYLATGVYFQSRILGLPLLVLYVLNKEKKIRSELLILFVPLLISVSVPVLGLLTERELNLIDVGYVVSFIYLIFFVQAMRREQELFINFISVFTMANIIYAIAQTVLMNLGLSKVAMIHSNLPSQLISGYILPPAILPYTYRFSGLFNESSPLIFYLCCSFSFLLEINKVKKSRVITIIQFSTFVTILLSGSKISYAFLLVLLILKLVSFLQDELLKKTAITGFLAFSTYQLITKYSEISSFLTDTLPAFGARHTAASNSFFRLSDIDVLGNGFLPSAGGEAGGLDAITIIIRGYGLMFGFGLLFTFLILILTSRIKSKEAFISIYILALSSNGSFLIVQYTLFFTMIYVIEKYSHHSKVVSIETKKLVGAS